MNDEVAENKRARVRRLLIEPLEVLGFRRNAKMPADAFKAKMANMIDQLVYMSDDSLGTMLEMVQSKGQGANRDIWPAPATFLSFAELIEPRPVEELSGLLRWFRSVEGPRAMEAGTLVETWSYFHKHKRPPKFVDRELQARANSNRNRCQLTKERMARDRADSHDVRWMQSYEARLAYCEAIVRGDDLEGAA